MAAEIRANAKLSAGLTYEQAVDTQLRMRAGLITEPPSGPISTVGGADVAFASDDVAVAAVLVFTWPDLDVIDVGIASREVDFPYIPGLLSFREVPVIQKAFLRLSAHPDVLFCDGQGTAHPRRFGLACHVGVALDIPTIGVAKSRLTGRAKEPGAMRGSWAPLLDRGEEIGRVLRTRDSVNPVFVSPGHRMDMETAVRMTLLAGRGYRIPEPTRQADALVAEAKKFVKG